MDYRLVTPRSVPQPSAELAAEMSAKHKLNFTLRRMVAAHQAGALTEEDRRPAEFGPIDTVLVTIQAEPGRGRAAALVVIAAGGFLLSSSEDFLDAYVPLAALAVLEHATSIRHVSPGSRLIQFQSGMPDRRDMPR